MASTMSLASALFFCVLLVASSHGVMAASALPAYVANTAELVSALSGGASEIVIRNSFQLTSDVPTVTRNVTIHGDELLCADQTLKGSEIGFCSIDALYKRRHFTVGKGGNLTIKNRLELRKGAAIKGGSIYVTEGGSLNTDGISFSYNFASAVTYGGGAIEADNGSSIDIVNTNFKRNTAGFGGAIDVSGGAYANIVSSYFRRNNATVAGGAISFVGNSNGNITYAYFANNFASVGGAVHIKTANASICKSFPKNNTASLTGSVYLVNKAATLNYCFNATIRKRSIKTSVQLVLGGLAVEDCYC